ncbi:glutathione S-transferase family protein [Limoniibacter endophyticus]|uniref:Glutathione S-transferase n=1 Tax=Limoniibacter endophyticus TaxID=1565040 RepID=A0A8J3DLT3_9HYPH|nr:glutathione S-transferase family protein [Limoniibacter endophyticus]GHC68733.1 glutathione S-transferase [Limoniibacter endophyticus]
MIKFYDLVGADHARPYSPHCWKVKMALAHKGLPYELVPTTFLGIREVEGGNATKTLPFIVDGDNKVTDSFQIALYLDAAYGDRPTLFDGEAGIALSRFIERWALTTLHPFMVSAVVQDIWARQDEENQAYFRESREKALGRKLEEIVADRDARRDAFLKTLEPLRQTLGYQDWIGGKEPLFADYIVFGALQWPRIMSTFETIPEGDPIHGWFERCLDLHEGLGRTIPAAA